MRTTGWRDGIRRIRTVGWRDGIRRLRTVGIAGVRPMGRIRGRWSRPVLVSCPELRPAAFASMLVNKRQVLDGLLASAILLTRLTSGAQYIRTRHDTSHAFTSVTNRVRTSISNSILIITGLERAQRHGSSAGMNWYSGSRFASPCVW